MKLAISALLLYRYCICSSLVTTGSSVKALIQCHLLREATLLPDQNSFLYLPSGTPQTLPNLRTSILDSTAVWNTALARLLPTRELRIHTSGRLACLVARCLPDPQHSAWEELH